MSLTVVMRQVRSSCQLCTNSAACMETATSGTWSRHRRRAVMAPAEQPPLLTVVSAQPWLSCLGPWLTGFRGRGMNRALGEGCARQGECQNRKTKARMWHQQQVLPWFWPAPVPRQLLQELLPALPCPARAIPCIGAVAAARSRSWHATLYWACSTWRRCWVKHSSRLGSVRDASASRDRLFMVPLSDLRQQADLAVSIGNFLPILCYTAPSSLGADSCTSTLPSFPLQGYCKPHL